VRAGAAALVAGAALAVAAGHAQPARPVVHVASIQGVIDLGLAPFVRRVLDDAARARAAAVVFEIETFGGRVDAAVQIRDALLEARVPTVAFVDKRAISAGALIALAAERLAMAGGGTIGAAQPVAMGPGGARAASEKTVSYVRKEFRATAERRGRPVAFAEAMVDADVEIPGVKPRGKLLTLTTEEALHHRVADLRADSLEALLGALGLRGAEVRRQRPAWAEAVVRGLTHPLVASLLVTLGTLGILTELQAPGLLVPGAVGLVSLALFFWGHWIARLVGWEDLALVGAGAVLLAVEVFVLPGFGVAGALGLLALLVGLALSLVGPGATLGEIAWAIAQILLSLVLAVAGLLVLLRWRARRTGT
jgi:membrane-bound serine protease (ClpP class)